MNSTGCAGARLLLVVMLLPGLLIVGSAALARPYRADPSARHRTEPVVSLPFRGTTGKRPAVQRPDAMGVISGVTGYDRGPDTVERSGRPGAADHGLLLDLVCQLCAAAPAGPEPLPAFGLIGVPGTPGLDAGLRGEAETLLHRRAFLQDCGGVAGPCTGFDAVPQHRAGIARASPRLSLALAAPLPRRVRASGMEPVPDAILRDYVDITELIATSRWHGSVLAPLVRLTAPSEKEAGPTVVTANDAPGLLDIGDAPDTDVLTLISGWFRRASDTETMALFALCLFPGRRRLTV